MSGSNMNPLLKIFSEIVEGLAQGVDEAQQRQAKKQAAPRQRPAGGKSSGVWADATDGVGNTHMHNVRRVTVDGVLYLRARDLLVPLEKTGVLTNLVQSIKLLTAKEKD